jgi:hypothetical protein
MAGAFFAGKGWDAAAGGRSFSPSGFPTLALPQWGCEAYCICAVATHLSEVIGVQYKDRRPVLAVSDAAQHWGRIVTCANNENESQDPRQER